MSFVRNVELFRNSLGSVSPASEYEFRLRHHENAVDDLKSHAFC